MINYQNSILLAILICFSAASQSQDAVELINKGLHFTQKGEYTEAISNFNAAIAIDENNLDAYVKRAFAYSMLKEYEKAVSDYSKLIELKPNFAVAYFSRGSALNKLERFNEALADFDKVITMEPTNSEAYNNRGWSKKGLGDKDGACEDWKTSKKMGNKEAKIILKNNQC